MHESTFVPLLSKLPKDIELFRLAATKDGTELAEALKARCAAIIQKDQNIVKDRVIAIAKTKNHNISRGDISNIKVEKVNGGYDDWGTKLIDISAIEGEPKVDRIITFTDFDDNNSSQTTNFMFEYHKDVVRTTSWTFTVGVKIKGGTAIFSGYEIDFGAEFSVLHSETDTIRWSKQIPVAPHTRAVADAILEIGHGSSVITGTFEVSKGTVKVSCDIQKHGSHHRSENIKLTDILHKPDLRRFSSQGTFESDLSIKGITSNSEEPLE